MDYSSFIREAKLIDDVESTTTTGDIEYQGTALEIYDPQGKELFHIVVDDEGKKQVLFLENQNKYRIPLELMERIITRAREVVKNENEL